MSRLGKTPVSIPKGAKISVSGRTVNAEGPAGKLSWQHPVGVSVAIDGDKVNVSRNGDDRQLRAFHGLTRAYINNMLLGVTAGFEKKLKIVGVGWNAKMAGQGISLQIGFCHNVDLKPPVGVKVEVPQPQDIVIKGCDKQAVGQFAAEVRKVRPPEPYNQKGIRYHDEVVPKKAGKSFVSGG